MTSGRQETQRTDSPRSNESPDAHEQRRLTALRRYNIFESETSDESIQRIPRMAARMFDASIAMLNFVDEDMLRVRAAVGLDEYVFDREITFCHQTIQQEDILVVLDAPEDDRFRNSPLVDAENGLRFYAGAPIRTPDGYNIGTVGIADTKPRSEFGASDRKLLADLAATAVDEIELHRSHLRLRQIIDLIPHLVFAKDIEGRYILVNEAIADSYDRTFDEIRGKTDHELLLDENQADQFRSDDLDVIKSGEPKYIPEEHLTEADGTRRVLETRKIPFEMAESGEPAVLGVAVDITERTRLQQDLRNFFNLPLDLMAIAGLDGYFRRVNPAFVDTLGYSEAELLEKHYTDLIHPDDVDKTREVIEALDAGEQVTDFENRLRCKDGSYRWLSWRIAPEISDDRMYAVARDITEWKETERIKDEFISVVSHELRTPLTSVRGALDLVLSGELGALPEAAEHMLNIAHENSQRLGRLVDDILDVQKIEEGRVDFGLQSADPNELARRIVEANASFAAERGIDLIHELPDDPSPVRVDPDRLQQVMTNLISNAVKFSPSGEQVIVRVSCPDEKTGRVEVQDHGPGISEEFRDKLFDKFAQSDASATRTKGGTGLGLSIARSLTERMGGTIDYETEADVGSTFFVTFPNDDSADTGDEHDQAPDTSNSQQAASTTDRPKPMILHVEDDFDTAEVLRRVVRDFASVENARTVADANRLLTENRFDLVILDLNLPDGSPMELVEAKHDTDNDQTPVLVFSGRELDREPSHAFADVLMKGRLDIDELRQKIRRNLPGERPG